MKLFNGMSPNGSRVSVFLAEKGVEVPVEPIDVIGGGTRTEAFLRVNSLGQVPVLQLADGRHLTESIAICRYFEALHPSPPLFGRTVEEQAFVEMWNRRMELNLFGSIGDVGLHEFEFFKDKVEQVPAYAASQRRLFLKRLTWLNEEIADERPFIAGDTFSVADITGISMLMVADLAGIGIPDTLVHVKRWEHGVRARPTFPKPPQHHPE